MIEIPLSVALAAAIAVGPAAPAASRVTPPTSLTRAALKAYPLGTAAAGATARLQQPAGKDSLTNGAITGAVAGGPAFALLGSVSCASGGVYGGDSDCAGPLLTLALAPSALGQSGIPVRVRDRVKVTAPMLPEPLYGRVTKIDPAADVIVVSTPGDDAQVTLPISALWRIDVSRGRARGRVALLAGAAGLLGAGSIGAREAGTVGAVAFGGTGFTFAALAGSAYAPERWRSAYDRQITAGGPVHVAVSRSGRVKRFADGTIGVGGERNRGRGVLRGALLLGAIAAVFGGIDKGQGELRTGEYARTVAGNVAIGAALGYLISPRGWQRLPSSGGTPPRKP